MGLLNEGSEHLVDFLRRENLVLVRRERWGEVLGKEQAVYRLSAVAEAARMLDTAIGQWKGVALSPDVARAWIALEDALDGLPSNPS
jgi:hypothetical protein